MAALSDPGAFTKGAEKQAETMKGLGIEQTDAKAEAKKKEEEKAKKGTQDFFSFFLYKQISFGTIKEITRCGPSFLIISD